MYNNFNNQQQYQFGSGYQNFYGTNNNTNPIYQQQNSANFTQHPLQQQQQMSNPYHQQNSLPFSKPPNFQGVPFFFGVGGKNSQNVLNRIDTSSFLHKSNISPEFSKMKPLEMPNGYKKNY